MTDTAETPHWWGTRHIDAGHSAQWSIGQLRLTAERLPSEWRLHYDRSAEALDEQETWAFGSDAFNPEDYSTTTRFVFSATPAQISLQPMLADRPVIIRPATPLNLPAGEEITLFVSSPLWVGISVGEPARKLTELYIQRPSDTWFGPSTQEGELCYASRTSARLHLEEVPVRPHRAITPVVVRNRAASTLLLERFSLPTPYLSLFATERGLLWTQAVTLIREQDGDMASLQIGQGAPQQAVGAALLGEPRQQADKGVLIRAFSALFEQGKK